MTTMKPKSSRGYALVIAFFILAVIKGLFFVAFTAKGESPQAQQVETTAPANPAYIYRGLALKVVDGDTIDVMVDLGFKVSIWQRLRLLDVYAAERNEPNGKAHKEALEKLLPRGADVIIRTVKDGTDKYGRYLADVWVGDTYANGTMRKEIGAPAGKGTKH